MKSKNFDSTRKKNFLQSIPVASIYADKDLLTIKCKFNFSYFDIQSAGQSFEDLTGEQRLDLLLKLKEYSNEPLSYWLNAPIGKKAGKVFSIYGSFPLIGNFKHPKHVPHEVRWCRFRLSYSGRLVGFVMPHECKEVKHKTTEEFFDLNTFYVVFLDLNHEFWRSC